MKKLIMITLALVVIGIILYRQYGKNDSKAVDQVMKILDRQAACWNNHNIDCFMVGYWPSDSLMFVGSSGITYGYDQVKENYKKRYPDDSSMGNLSFGIKEVNQLNEEVILVVGKFELKREMGNVSGYFSLLFKKIGGDWLIVADHTSSES